MSSRPIRFAAIPNVPQQGLTPGQFQTLSAMKENLDYLTGARSGNVAAVLKGSVTVAPAPQLTMPRVTATGAGYTISGVTVPSLDDYAALIINVQSLANDVFVLRETVNALINQLKG